jgi:hypothetical protein
MQSAVNRHEHQLLPLCHLMSLLKDAGSQAHIAHQTNGVSLTTAQVTPAGCALGLGLGSSYNANSGTVRLPCRLILSVHGRRCKAGSVAAS